ncbi:unnamed protein product [Boreogadus saida]
MLSISPALPVSVLDTIGCLVGLIRKETIRCNNISTGDGYYKYPWPWVEVCDIEHEVYADNQTKLADGIGELRQQELCQNLTVKCFYKSDGKPKEFCAKFVIDHSSSTDSDATSLLDPGKPKQQLNNTSEQTDMDSDEPSPTDQSTLPAAVWIVVAVAVAGLALLALLARLAWLKGAAWWRLRKKKQMQTQNQGEELTEQNRLDDGDQPAPGNGIPLVFAGRGPFTEIGTVTLTNDGAAAAPLDGPRAVDSLLDSLVLWRPSPGRSGASHNEREKDNRLVVTQIYYLSSDVNYLTSEGKVYLSNYLLIKIILKLTYKFIYPLFSIYYFIMV